MNVWLNYAYISNNTVQNVACYLYTGYNDANLHAKDFCKDQSAFAVNVTQYPVQIGDSYRNGEFYHINDVTGEEEKVPYFPTVEQQTEINQEAIAAQSAAIDDLAIAILEG